MRVSHLLRSDSGSKSGVYKASPTAEIMTSISTNASNLLFCTILIRSFLKQFSEDKKYKE